MTTRFRVGARVGHVDYDVLSDRLEDLALTPERAAGVLAQEIARRRFGGVSMDGRHNPTPGEELMARHFIELLMANWWEPPKDTGGT